jgi:hypothetical protein
MLSNKKKLFDCKLIFEKKEVKYLNFLTIQLKLN